MEFFQFHRRPSRLGVLLSREPVEQERDRTATVSAYGRYAPTIKDLAPRDVVSRSIYQEIKEGRGLGPRGDYVYLDLTHLDPRILEEKLPDITEFARVYLQVEPTREPVPIQPTAHYAMGGIHRRQDESSRARRRHPCPSVRGRECACLRSRANGRDELPLASWSSGAGWRRHGEACIETALPICRGRHQAR